MRVISWIKAAQKEFDSFPLEAKQKFVRALKIAAEGETADLAKPTKGLGSGVFEIAFHTPMRTASCMQYKLAKICG